MVVALASCVLGGGAPQTRQAGASIFPTVQFGFTGGTQTYTVPSDGSVCALGIQAVGGTGGGFLPASGGVGGQAYGVFDVSPGDVVTVAIGGVGGDQTVSAGGAGGFGGGGAGGQGGAGQFGGGGGGGATTVRINGAVIVVAGGGAGSTSSGLGGRGGRWALGVPWSAPPGTASPVGFGESGSPNETGGGGATPEAVGAGGGSGGGTATAGTPGVGGTGGTGGNGQVALQGGGGGGGGWFGGGGGGGGGADVIDSGPGGGGSSFVAPTARFTTFPSIVADGAGNGAVSVMPFCWSSVIVTNTLIGAAPAGTTFKDSIVCSTFPFTPETITFDATGASTSNNVVQTIDPDCTLSHAVNGTQPVSTTFSCVPADLCTVQQFVDGSRSFRINTANRSGPLGTVNVTNVYAVPLQPNFTG